MMKLIIDTDPGIDDAMAYCYAHASPDVEVLALTTVFGNVTIDNADRNSLWLTQVTKASTRVFRGADSPVKIPNHPPATHVHGENGLGNFETGPLQDCCEAESAPDYLVRMAREFPGEITVCAIGPLTNVAHAIEKDPDFITKLRQLVIMGGSLREGGNVTAHAEANFWHDPHAANAVLNAPGSGNIIVVGLDVTHKVRIGPESFQRFADNAPQIGGFLQNIGDFYLNFYEATHGSRRCSLHDPCAVIACIHPELFTMEGHRLAVITSGEKSGMMIIQDADVGRVCQVCTNVQDERVITEFEQVVVQNP